mmetsp:Transcript_19434/g.41556  ORF Transcript_19434/g.41556 Transcript_19434/m.41556 type:complete len:204 (+) Transcript_19434:205-816(+)|eukprot:CAMPEP_0172533734 /NCGR_PEP_ID=MMETSP1067-20121228/6330_1 /TAXON_ID=265564 ORGANISM="Thalassiosira punctigera, Strain Tpunct2005C2" /NCGR_SAMPLE_ID=MMETSP1067 /ASSEMBLY_ACC=CAM_ASM_000444 /LENGTH=203 /DNA_ID=CAMNT_0013318409 /DNA_START=96 /DNA_END=707 /DNA_ORIENTATION=-
MIKAAPSKKQPLLNAGTNKSNAATHENRRDAVSVITIENEETKVGVRERKKGHKFFFVCCDTKRAVIWLNTLILMVNVFTLTAAVVQTDRVKADGYVQAIIVRCCGMFVTFTTLLGAYWYSKSIVLVGLAFTCYQLTIAVFKCARYNWNGGYNEDGPLDVIVPAVWYTLLFYAEGAFISEVNDGIMSAETYKRRERYSCCCNC